MFGTYVWYILDFHSQKGAVSLVSPYKPCVALEVKPLDFVNPVDK